MRRGAWIRVALMLLVGAASFVLLPRVMRAFGPITPEVETASLMPPAREITADTLGHGQSLAQLLAGRGLDAAEIHSISEVVRGFKMPRTFRPGIEVRVAGLPGERPDRLKLQLNPDSLLHLARIDSVWSGRVEVVPIVVDTVRLSGVIETSLWFAHLGGDAQRLGPDEFKELVYSLADVFAWKIDFTRDIRKGDAFRVAVEREVRPDGSVRSRRFLAVELVNASKTYRAIPYPRPGGRIAYFSPEGEAMRGAFMRYPVPYRITSGFTNRRYHPILKRNRPHQGIDYGAPHGTGIQSTAAGTVTFAGTKGGYGRMVEIRHNGGIRTRYAHLSAYGRGIRPGARVDQGQIIGRVGSSGLATGPHLHYEFLQNGVHRNPLTVSLPSEPSLEKELMDDFRRVRDASLALIDGVAIPDGPLLAGRGDDAGAPNATP